MNASDSELDRPTDELLALDLQHAKDENTDMQFTNLSESLQQRMRLWLSEIQSNLYGDGGMTSPDLRNYVFSVISIMAISAVIWGVVWKSGTLDAFLLRQYEALSEWVDQKTVNIEVSNLRFQGVKEKKTRHKAILAKEAAEKNKGWSAIWGRVISLPQVGFTNLTNGMSWTVLWTSWTAFFMDPFDLMPGLVSQNTKFRMLCLMTVVKIVTYTYDLVKNKCDGIFHVNYRTFIPRITLAILKSFMNLLRRFIRYENVQVDTTDNDKILLSDAKIQLRALKAASESLSTIAIDEFDELIENPIQFGMKIQDAKSQISKFTSRLAELVENEMDPVIRLRIHPAENLMSSEFAGKFSISGNYFGSVRYSMFDSEKFYNIWITIVETIHRANNFAKITYRQVLTQTSVNDKNPRWVRGYVTPSHWNKPNFGNIAESWSKQRAAMASLQKFVKMNILPECQDIVSFVEDVSKVPNDDAAGDDTKTPEFVLDVPVELIQHANVLNNDEWTISTASVGHFFVLQDHQTQFENQVRRIHSISKQCGQLGVKCYEDLLQETTSIIESFHDYIIRTKEEYLRNIRVIYNRHKSIILLCKTMCRLLQYFISNYDAFILTLKVYTQNKIVPLRLYESASASASAGANVDIRDIWKSKGAFRVLKEKLDNFGELKTSHEFVSFQEAQDAIYAPCSVKHTLKMYLRHASGIMCNIVHSANPNDPFVSQVARLFNITDLSKCDNVETCDTCMCIGEENHASNIKLSDIVHQQSEHVIDTLDSIGYN